MSAFKAANPDAVFEDFIRWHSPGDWEHDIGSESSKSLVEHDWPPHGRLSQRMSEQGNMWRKIWNDAPALPASEQNPLLDPNREGEKVGLFEKVLIYGMWILGCIVFCDSMHLCGETLIVCNAFTSPFYFCYSPI